jgi:GMP synthase-like glutamine amidotransferase
MKLTILQTGAVPEHLQPEHGDYPAMFRRMFDSTGIQFDYDDVNVLGGDPLPDPATLDGIVITGSPAGVYEDHFWLPPLREFIREAYRVGTPMVGICFGHQVIADALGGVVTKSDRGWGLGRHNYQVGQGPEFLQQLADKVAVACSHQDQVIVPPDEAQVILSSEFAPNAGLYYRNGKALSFQPHPEFDDTYATALVEMRRGRATDEVVETALGSMATPSDSQKLRHAIAEFFVSAAL